MRAAHSVRTPASAIASELVSPRVGIVRRIAPAPRSAEEPRPPYVVQALLAHCDFRAGSDHDRSASGSGETHEQATMSALGEAVERYCATVADRRGLQRASLVELSPAAVSPEELVLYSARQYALPGWRWPRFDPSADITWASARDLTRGGEAWVPASLVYLGGAAFAEGSLCPSTSNGLAAGSSLEMASLGGLCELIERDAFLLTWMHRLPVPEVELAGIGGTEESIHRQYARFGVTTRVFDLTTDVGVPVMLAIALDSTGRGPAAFVGLGCHPSPRTALRKALFEICQIRPGEASRMAANPPRGRLRAYQDIVGLFDHSAFFALPENLHELAFLLEHGRRVRLDELRNDWRGEHAADLAVVVDKLAAVGSRALCIELTTPDVAPLGFHVVRMLATGLQPIHFGWGQERLGGRRLFSAPMRLGYRDTLATEADLNPCPHPIA